jgi:hypothetical protein
MSGHDAYWLLMLMVLIGFATGFTWLHRITGLSEDLNRSYFRSKGQRGTGGSRLPDVPTDLPTGGWLLTRGAIVIGFGSIAFAVLGPLVFRRWLPALELGPVADLVRAIAISAAVTGTAWMILIARDGPENGARWRSRD